jgi:hypothetical protein
MLMTPKFGLASSSIYSDWRPSISAVRKVQFGHMLYLGNNLFTELIELGNDVPLGKLCTKLYMNAFINLIFNAFPILCIKWPV